LKKTNEHVFFRAETGSGKSFILAMYALNQPRSLNEQNYPTTATLVLVPNPDLAIQYYYWITQVLGSSVKDSDRAARIVQAFYRTEEAEERAQEAKLSNFPRSHILISTPTRMLDMIASNSNAFDLSALQCIILDEADEIVQPRDLTTSRKIQHRTPGEILLDYIFENRKAQPSPAFLRLIATSATLSTQFTTFIEQKQWTSDPITSYALATPSKVHITSSNTEQHVIMVSLLKSPTPELTPDRFRIKPALLPYVSLHHNVRTNSPKTIEPPRQSAYPPNYLSIPAMQHILRETRTNKAVALIPHGASKADFVWACQYFGLTGARQLRFSLTEAEKGFLEPKPIDAGGPVLYVSYPKDIRGVDLKNIGIVFVMGEFGSVEDYVHIVGRTGRLRKFGRVITFLEDSMENLEQKLMNIAIKMVRSGAPKPEMGFAEAEKDLKALPGDEFEDIRRERGIVAVTDEVIQKEDRERKATEDREKWLSISQSAKCISFEDGEDEEIELERPISFGMSTSPVTAQETRESPTIEENMTDRVTTTLSNDWRAALAEVLQSLPKEPTKTDSEERQSTHSPKSRTPERPRTHKGVQQHDPISAKMRRSKTSVQQDPPTFPPKPEFPLQQYREAWKGVNEYYAKNKDGFSSSGFLSATEVTPLKSNLHNEAVHGRDDPPIVPADISLSTNNPEDVKAALQGESLRQVEEAKLIAPGPRKRGRKPKEVKVEPISKKRGRPRKNTELA
jgi:superfamily II DNA/RNA helicase